jgi:hypothetical protein
MSSSTPRYVIPKLLVSDPVISAPTVLAALADRVDLLLGEAGSFSASPAANTTLLTPVVLSRTYPGNATAGAPAGAVWVWVQSTASASVGWNYWITSWAGTTTTVTGFTVGMQWAAAQAGRVFNWRYFPVL